MGKKFEELEVGDQLEMRLGKQSIVYGGGPDYDPNKVCRVAIVTHIWYDPVDKKEYVGLAYLRKDGKFGEPTEKRTIRGLSQTGWEKATTDWCAHAKAIHAADKKRVVQFRRKK
jgi:hypothetical protein